LAKNELGNILGDFFQKLIGSLCRQRMSARTQRSDSQQELRIRKRYDVDVDTNWTKKATNSSNEWTIYIKGSTDFNLILGLLHLAAGGATKIFILLLLW
jgi:hypothetical protein